MYLVAGQCLARTAATSWSNFVKVRLFAPLDMTSTVTSIKDLKADKNLASPHVVIDGIQKPIPYENLDNIAPAGAINSNLIDMTHWLTMLLDRGRYEGRQVLDSAIIDEMFSSQIPIADEPSPYSKAVRHQFLDYGLGWALEDYRGYKLVCHRGNADGMYCLIGLLPQKKLGIIILANSDFDQGPMPSALMYWTLDAYLHSKPTDWSRVMLRIYRREHRKFD